MFRANIADFLTGRIGGKAGADGIVTTLPELIGANIAPNWASLELILYQTIMYNLKKHGLKMATTTSSP